AHFPEKHNRCGMLEIGHFDARQADDPLTVMASVTFPPYTALTRAASAPMVRFRCRTVYETSREGCSPSPDGTGLIYLATDSPIAKRGAGVAGKGLGSATGPTRAGSGCDRGASHPNATVSAG